MVIVVEQFGVFFVRVAGYHLLGRNADTNSDSNIFQQNPLYLPAFRLKKIDNIFYLVIIVENSRNFSLKVKMMMYKKYATNLQL